MSASRLDVSSLSRVYRLPQNPGYNLSAVMDRTLTLSVPTESC